MDEINNRDYMQKDAVLASRMSRFWASLIDGLIIYFFYFFDFCRWYLENMKFGKENAVSGFRLLLTLGLLAIVIYQIVLLSKYGQTIGKKLLKIRIVDVKTGENGGFFKNVILRIGVSALISIIPIYPLIDILFIFGEDRRCLHDRIAGTKVIKV